MTKRHLPFNNMAERHPGLTPAVAVAYLEAARVCLDRHHTPPVDVDVANSGVVETVVAEWQQTDERTRGAWANDTDATEAGAYACALAAVELAKGFVAIHRAETRTGADYYIGPIGHTSNDLEDCLRLEVSGMDQGSGSAVEQRLREKLTQAAAGISNLPAMAGIVAFKIRRIALSLLESE
jgi:hypothetical protein